MDIIKSEFGNTTDFDVWFVLSRGEVDTIQTLRGAIVAAVVAAASPSGPGALALGAAVDGGIGSIVAHSGPHGCQIKTTVNIFGQVKQFLPEPI